MGVLGGPALGSASAQVAGLAAEEASVVDPFLSVRLMQSPEFLTYLRQDEGSAMAALPPDIKSALQILANLEGPNEGRNRSLLQRYRRFAELDAGISAIAGLGYSVGKMLGVDPFLTIGVAAISAGALYSHRIDQSRNMLGRASHISIYAGAILHFNYAESQKNTGPDNSKRLVFINARPYLHRHRRRVGERSRGPIGFWSAGGDRCCGRRLARRHIDIRGRLDPLG